MLPTSYSQAYHTLLNRILTLENLLNQSPLELTQIEKRFQEAEQCFRKQVISLTVEDLESTFVPRWQSLHTEMQRTFRLLNTDFLFLRSAKQSVTKEKRLEIIGDRLNNLSNYCRLILDS